MLPKPPKAHVKMPLMINVTIPFKKRWQAFAEAQEWTLLKYRPLAETLREKGHNVTVQVLIIGPLGAWDPSNKSILCAGKVPLLYAKLRGIWYHMMVEGHLHRAHRGCCQYDDTRLRLPDSNEREGTDWTHHRLTKPVNVVEYSLAQQLYAAC